MEDQMAIGCSGHPEAGCEAVCKTCLANERRNWKEFQRVSVDLVAAQNLRIRVLDEIAALIGDDKAWMATTNGLSMGGPRNAIKRILNPRPAERDHCRLFGAIHHLSMSFSDCEDCGRLHPSCACGFVDRTRSEAR